MRKALALLLVLVALDARAQSLQGHWDVRATRGYIGVVLIDADGRATWDSPNDGGRGLKYFGYVASRTEQNVEILLTNRARVTRAHCVQQSEDVMSCYNVRHDNTPSEPYMLVRVGPGPASLMPASR